MKSTIGILIAALLFAACTQPATTSTEAMVPIDSANRMISSYLNSIDYLDNDTDLQSLVLDAEAFRAYLDNPVMGSSVTHFEISLAHTLSYINSGNENQMAGYKAGALTVIVVGLDEHGNRLPYPGDLAINNASHCPPSCPPSAAAAIYPGPVNEMED